jgi:hypothetical protein
MEGGTIFSLKIGQLSTGEKGKEGSLERRERG